MRLISRFGPAALLVTTLSVPLAQQAGRDPGAPLDRGITEELTIRLFHVNFIAVDRRGRPVTDLKPEEIVVLDRGQRQQVAVLEPYYRPGETVVVPPSGPPRLRTEEPAPQTADRSRWVILFFDNFASRVPDRIASIEAALAYLDDGLDPRDTVAVFSFNGELHVLQSFTTDREQLRQGLYEAYGQVDRAITDRHDQLTELMRDLGTCRGQPIPWGCARRLSGAYEDERRREADSIMTALLHVLRSVGAIPGPKTLLLFSGGFARSSTADPIDAVRAVLGEAVADRMLLGQDQQLRDWQNQLAAEASRAKISIFTLNPASSVSNPLISAERGATQGRQNTFQIDVFRRSDQNAQASLAEIARRTGGTASESRNTLGSLRRVFEQAEGLYTIGYYPSLASPSAPHALKIKIKRRGVKAVWPREVPHLRPPRRLEGRLIVQTGECAGERRRAGVRLELELASLQFEVLQDRLVNNFSVYVTLQAPGSPDMLYRDYRMYNINHGRDDFARAVDPAIERTLTVPCRPLTVRASVVDAGSGARARFEETIER